MRIRSKEQIQEFFILFRSTVRQGLIPHFHHYLALAEACALLGAILVRTVFLKGSERQGTLRSSAKVVRLLKPLSVYHVSKL